MEITDLCQEVKNWFDVSKHFGKFEIENGTLELDFLQEGQFFRIVGSVFNDGVYNYPCCFLKDETFDGAVWALAIPESFVNLVDRITEWEEANQKSLDSPYQSESFGGYSYSKSEGSANYKARFKSELNRWRKV